VRFARQASIFRGPLDAVPVVGVLFLLALFMMIGSVVYTPGVLVRFDGPDAETITVNAHDEIIFQGKTNQPADLARLRAGEFKNPNMKSFRVLAKPGADPKLVEQVREVFQIQLPTNDIVNLTGTSNPTVVVAVNFRGQSFYENRPVQDAELKEELRKRLDAAGRLSKKLTMVLWADKAADNEVVMHLYRLARDAGITEFLLAERPAVSAAAGHQ
jgi:biopolymer transport protein ExbD